MRLPNRRPGKYTFKQFDPNITKEKYQELEENLDKLKKNQKYAIKEVNRLSQTGDYSDNPAYSLAKHKLRGINNRILELENQLNQAQIIEPPKNKNVIDLGHKVTIKTENKEKTYLILGSEETDPQKGIISRNSPIGLALLGRKIGDKIKIKLKNKEIECEIMKIE